MTKPLDPTSDEPREQELSLRGLSEAFAQALCRPDRSPDQEEAVEPPEVPDDFVDDEIEPEPPDPEATVEVDEACPISPRTILEAMLFVGNTTNQPLDGRRAAELMRGVEAAEIPELVNELNRDYLANHCPYQIISDGAGYRLSLREKFNPLRNKFHGRVREARLSQAAIDVLSIVAYKQPLTADQVNTFRGKPSSHLLAQLIRRQLLRLERPKDSPHRPVYHTTDRFLALFGLETIEDLPRAEELERR